MRVVVIGGGVAGLSTALALRDRGHEVIVLERARQPGGKVTTDRVDGWQVERGPAGVLDNAPATVALVARLGLERVDADDAAKRRYLVRDGVLREVPTSPPKLLLSRTLTLGEKWRLLREPKAASAPPPAAEETVAEFARRRFGTAIAERFVEPMVGGVFAGDYERLVLASALPRVAEMERAHGSVLKALIAAERARRQSGQPRAGARLYTLRGGMGALPAALAAALGDAVKPGVEARAVERHDGGLRIHVSDGALEAERVVVAVPAEEAAPLLRPLDAALGDAFAAIPSVGVAAVTLGWARGDVPHPLDGFGYLAPRRESPRLIGAIWASSAFPSSAPAGHVMVRCMLGGARDPGALALDDEALVDAARSALAPTLGVRATPRFVHVVRWAKAIAQYERGHAARVAAIEARGAALGLLATGAALRGIGVNDVIRDAGEIAARLP